MTKTRFCDLHVCARHMGEVNTNTSNPEETEIEQYSSEYLVPAVVGCLLDFLEVLSYDLFAFFYFL